MDRNPGRSLRSLSGPLEDSRPVLTLVHTSVPRDDAGLPGELSAHQRQGAAHSFRLASLVQETADVVPIDLLGRPLGCHGSYA